MNGAAALLESRTSTLKISSTAIIGSSHHFLLWHRKSQYSARKPPEPCPAAFSNSFIGSRCIVPLLPFRTGGSIAERRSPPASAANNSPGPAGGGGGARRGR